ncbi:MAG: hypothetical protein ACYCO0_03335, partial [Candidatus Micrarchaeaceae archaeon]
MNNNELNDLYTSKSINDILRFYDYFHSRNQLIRWMKNRKPGRAKIYEAKGKTDIIIVIPTADYNGKFAQNCRKNIFKGMHIIFIESGGITDKYFNYARNVNKGLKFALKYKPKWIIVSSDDMVKVDDISILENELFNLNKNTKLNPMILFAKGHNSKRRPEHFFLAKPRYLWD